MRHIIKLFSYEHHGALFPLPKILLVYYCDIFSTLMDWNYNLSVLWLLRLLLTLTAYLFLVLLSSLALLLLMSFQCVAVMTSFGFGSWFHTTPSAIYSARNCYFCFTWGDSCRQKPAQGAKTEHLLPIDKAPLVVFVGTVIGEECSLLL